MGNGRRSSDTLDMLLLSLLKCHRLSGYELANALRPPVAFIFPVKHSQIYPALVRLDRHGDISGEWVEQRGRPNKKVYKLLEQGRGRLRQWLLQPRTILTQNEAMLTVYNLNLIGQQAVERATTIYRRQCEDEKAQLEARWQLALRNVRDDKQSYVAVRAVYEFALDARTGRINWCDWVFENTRGSKRTRSNAKPVRAAPAGVKKRQGRRLQIAAAPAQLKIATSLSTK